MSAKDKLEESVSKVETAASGDWLRIERIYYTDGHGVARTWESAARNRASGAVAIVAVMKPSGRIILVRQFRPPAQGHVIEFPAGLIDRPEDVEVTALRELREETGYVGRMIRLLPPTFSSPGLSGEKVSLALVDVDEFLPENLKPVTSPDESESIETLLVPMDGLLDFLLDASAKGALLDSKLTAFAIGMRSGKPI
jgi:8-oxo-dGTP pyrophosphatase MutT (NUDIX family)